MHFVVRYAHVLERSVPTLDAGVVARLQAHSWPGNVRELEHVMQRAVLLCAGDVLRVKDVSFSSVAPSAGADPRPAAEQRTGEAVEAPPAEGAEIEGEKQQLVAALQETNWRVYGERGAAHLLGMHPEKLRSRMRVYGLQRPKHSS